MLTTVKTMSKKTLSIFLAFAMCFTAFVLCNPIEADAMSVTDYDYYNPNDYYYYPKGTTFVESFRFGQATKSDDAYNQATNNGDSNYKLISNENGGGRLDFNSGISGKDYVMVGYKTTTDITKANVTYIRNGHNTGGAETMAFKVRGKAYTFYKTSQDLNADVGGDYIFIYYTDDHNAGLPVVDIRGSTVQGMTLNGYFTVERNDESVPSDCNASAKGDYVYMYFDNASPYTKVTSNVNTLIAALDKTKSVQDKSVYTTASWAAYESALNTANEIWGAYNNKHRAGDRTVQEINAAVTNLNKAIDGLKTVIKINATANGGTTDVTEYEVSCGLNATVDFPASLYSATKEGHAFLGWNTDKNASSGSRSTMNVPLNSTVYAIFSINKYTVYFSNPVTLQTIDRQDVEYGKDATAPSMKEFTQNDESTHLLFKGWDKDFTNVKENLSVNAVFEVVPHNFVRTRFVAATCISKGTEVYKCSDCGYEKTTTLPVDSNNHTNTVDYPEKVATCQEYGYTAYTYCNDCKSVVKGRDRLPLADCSWSDWSVTEPTCTVDGVKSRKCTVCGKTESEVIPAKGHNWGDWAVVKAPTCEAAGRQQRVCATCSAAEVEILNALTHNYVDTVVAPTCTDRGYTLHKCDRCGTSYSDTYVDAAGHKWVDVGPATKEATCLDTGYQYQECSVCDESRTAVVPALGHNWTNENVIREATCDTDGLMAATCDRCGEVQAEIVIPALGHDWDEGTITKEATCTQDGIRVLSCKRESCGKTMETVLKAKGHAWDDGVVTKAPTCAQEGELIVTCTVCGEKQINIIAKLPHKYTGVVTKPTCTDQGYTEYSCSECGDKMLDDFVPALGHRFQTTIFAPTCLKEGYTFVRCSVCDHSQKKDFVDALGHDYVVSTVAPTCTEKGYDVHVCSRGDSTYKDNYVDSLGHEYAVTTVAPTCTERGYDLHTCTRGDHKYKDNYVDALGHSFVEILEVAPTLTQNGYVLFECEACGEQDKEIIYIGDRALVCVTLLDTNGNPVTEAVITVTNIGTGESYVITSDLNGYFTEVLPEGDYELYIDRDGYEDTIGYIYVVDGEATIDIPAIEDASCDCYCHQNNIWAKIFRIFVKIGMFLGIQPDCCADPQF